MSHIGWSAYNQRMIEIEQHEPGSPSEQSLYAALDQNLKQSSFAGSAAQAHGIACGLVCRDVKLAELDNAIEHLNFTDSSSIGALESLLEMNRRDLNQAEFGFDLWLPETDDLELQLEALAEWSQGYIIGLMYDGNGVLPHLSDELNESVQDIIEIAALEATSASSSEDEIAFVELREYLRMATQLIYEELNSEQPIESMPE